MKKGMVITMIKKIFYLLTTILLAVLGKLLLQADYIQFLQWWLAITCLGVIFMPLTSLIFASFHDKGYLFSKSIGIAICGYLMWFLSSAHVMKFTEVSCIITVVIGFVFNGIILFLQKKYKGINGSEENRERTAWNAGTFDAILSEELLFFGLFLLFTYIRGFKPEAYGTEKFMDFGFMTSMMRSEYMPPQDFWFSGTKLNYYYVGQYLATYLTKLSFVDVTLGYNLMLMMIGAFSFVLSYSLLYNVALQFIKDQGKKSKAIPKISGMIAGAAVCIAGNMHYPTYQWFEGIVRKFFGMEASTEKYWFPDATRFIGYHPETTDKTIHEFPAYSFVLGDLHAHVINILFVLTVLGILFAWLCTRNEVRGTKPKLWKEIFHPAIILIAFFIGLFHTTNFWDFPIYFVVAGAIILFSNMVVYNFKSTMFGVTALQGIFVIAFSEIVCLPFTLNFDQISTNICLTVSRTALNQMIILWGLPIVTVVCFIGFVIANFLKNQKQKEQLEAIKQKTAFSQFFLTLTNSDFFIIILGLCAIGLILIPEVVYVEDIYSGDYKRANTMFKLTYQAFIMFGICFGYIFLRLLCFGKTGRQKRYAAAGLILFALTLCYAQNAVNAWYGNIFDRAGYKGLDATAFLKTEMPDDELATNWLNENVTGAPIVLEANGDSYTDYQRVSVMTGLPTVLGWRTHEWLWKSDTTLLDERTADIELIYTQTNASEVQTDETEIPTDESEGQTDETTVVTKETKVIISAPEVLELLEKYQVSYLYVGKLEQDKFPAIDHDLLKSLGEVVFMSPATEEKTYETYIVQIKY
jgi:YYY domain-containing protein